MARTKKPKAVSPAPSKHIIGEGKNHYLVQLGSLDCPEIEVCVDGDRMDAVEAYMTHCGIICTEHKFLIRPVGETKVSKIGLPVAEPEDGEDESVE